MHWTYCNIRNISPEVLQDTYAQLTQSRKAHIDRLQQEQDKRRSLTGEFLARKLLAEHYGDTTAQLHRKDNGQPYVTGRDLYVSIAHCNDLVACAIGSVPVGIDIEQIRPITPALCRKVCVEEELDYLQLGNCENKRCQDPEVLRRFFEIWTAKEAYFKKCGTGITNLKSVNILTLPRQVHEIGDYILQII